MRDFLSLELSFEVNIFAEYASEGWKIGYQHFIGGATLLQNLLLLEHILEPVIRTLLATVIGQSLLI